MTVPHIYHVAVRLHRGKVLVAGGNTCSAIATNIAELYTSVTVTVPLLVSLNDINKDGAPEIAVVTYNPTLKKFTATVKNAQTDGLVKQITFDDWFVPTTANVIPDLNKNGALEIAVLGVRSSDQAVQVEVRDSLSGSDTMGLAVLQQSDTELRVQLKNALTDAQIRDVSFSVGYNDGRLHSHPRCQR